VSAPTVIRAADGGAVAARAARLIGELLEATLTARGSVHLALAGGTTPAGAYTQLRCSDWAGVELWFGDERCVGPDDPESNYRMVAETLLGHAAGALVHRIEGELGAERAAAAYDALLRGRVSADEGTLPVLDIVLLGIGEDGHTASLFPHNPALAADGVTCVAVHDAPKPPPDRVSLSLEMLRAARTTILLASGPGKADALARALAQPDAAVPASLLARERLTVIADSAALADQGAEPRR
jgi:6-phosphogluconolactonase